MSRVLMICAIVLLATQLSSAVILRPKWYPYFRRGNQASNDGGSNTGESAQPADTLTRQARALEADRSPFCPDALQSEECLERIIAVVTRIFQLNSLN